MLLVSGCGRQEGGSRAASKADLAGKWRWEELIDGKPDITEFRSDGTYEQVYISDPRPSGRIREISSSGKWRIDKNLLILDRDRYLITDRLNGQITRQRDMGPKTESTPIEWVNEDRLTLKFPEESVAMIRVK